MAKISKGLKVSLDTKGNLDLLVDPKHVAIQNSEVVFDEMVWVKLSPKTFTKLAKWVQSAKKNRK